MYRESAELTDNNPKKARKKRRKKDRKEKTLRKTERTKERRKEAGREKLERRERGGGGMERHKACAVA